MHRAVVYRWDNVDYYFFFSGEAMLQAGERWPDVENVGEVVSSDRPPRENLFALAQLLSEHGELARRRLGYPPSPMFGAEQVDDILLLGTPYDMSELRNHIMIALTRAMKREVEDVEDDEVDLLLIKLERQKKTETD